MTDEIQAAIRAAAKNIGIDLYGEYEGVGIPECGTATYMEAIITRHLAPVIEAREAKVREALEYTQKWLMTDAKLFATIGDDCIYNLDGSVLGNVLEKNRAALSLLGDHFVESNKKGEAV